MSKLCKDCKHSREPERDEEYYREFLECQAPKNMNVNPVTGEIKPINKYCKNHRYDGMVYDILTNTCGSRGKWFEPK